MSPSDQQTFPGTAGCGPSSDRVTVLKPRLWGPQELAIPSQNRVVGMAILAMPLQLADLAINNALRGPKKRFPFPGRDDYPLMAAATSTLGSTPPTSQGTIGRSSVFSCFQVCYGTFSSRHCPRGISQAHLRLSSTLPHTAQRPLIWGIELRQVVTAVGMHDPATPPPLS
jgi:hypothetical protein